MEFQPPKASINIYSEFSLFVCFPCVTSPLPSKLTHANNHHERWGKNVKDLTHKQTNPDGFGQPGKFYARSETPPSLLCYFIMWNAINACCVNSMQFNYTCIIHHFSNAAYAASNPVPSPCARTGNRGWMQFASLPHSQVHSQIRMLIQVPSAHTWLHSCLNINVYRRMTLKYTHLSLTFACTAASCSPPAVFSTGSMYRHILKTPTYIKQNAFLFFTWKLHYKEGN